jgi:hypothetical protein
MHLTDRCRFLNCSVRIGGGGGIGGVEGWRGGRVGSWRGRIRGVEVGGWGGGGEVRYES